MYTDFQSSKRVYVMLGMFVPSTYTYKNDVRYREKKGISLSLSLSIRGVGSLRYNDTMQVK